MSWMQQLYDTYAQATQLGSSEKRIAPICHTVQNAHINIVLDENAKFVRAKVLKKYQILLPATEASEARGNVDAPHGLADKLQYVAKDYAHWGGTKKAFFKSYSKQLEAWCEAGAPRKVKIVRDYVIQGTVLTDLIQKAHVFEAASTNTVLTEWPQDRGEAPEIFGSLPKEGGFIEPGSALVCWSVEIFGDPEKDTWNDPAIWQSWVVFQSTKEGRAELCLVSGQESPIARLHPAKLRHSGDKAKLISANDAEGMTFRGRFSDSGQAAAVGSDVTQKAHNALRWLIDRQGIRNGDQVTVAWAISGKQVPQPLADPQSFDDDEPVPQSEDLGRHIAKKINLKRRGYAQKLEGTDQLSLISLDSATPGRMSIAYYREFLSQDYFQQLDLWYAQFAWYQRVTKDIKVPEKTKPDRRTVWPLIPPSPLAIAQAIYGQTLSDELKKQVFAKVLPCIAEGAAFPRVLMSAAVQRAGNPMAVESWEWWRNLGVACALFKGFQERSQLRRYEVALEETNRSRDYLFGRLLGLADHIEDYALSIAQESRPTTAMRLMQRFSNRPRDTWKNIEEALHPYFMRIRSRYPSMERAFRSQLDDVHHLMSEAENGAFDNAALSGEYLLGYHLQRRWLRDHTIDDGVWVLKFSAALSNKPEAQETEPQS
jgi:CRISPR-associated protein Csd1